MKITSLFIIFGLLFAYPAIAETADAEFERQNEAAKAAMADGDFDKAFEIWRPYAENGNKRAQNNLAYMYLEGAGIPKDFDRAKAWYEKSAAQGLPQAQYQLAKMLYYGKEGLSYGQDAEGNPIFKDPNRKADIARALTLYRQSAGQGFILAQLELGDLYYGGKPAFDNADKAEALYWYEKAAEQGEPSAIYMTEHLLTNRESNPERYCGKVLPWLNRGAEAGRPGAYLALAAMYGEEGFCAQADKDKYREMLHRAKQLYDNR